MRKMGGRRGITLVGLVITIIIMLILAGITISLTFGENGIITRAKQAAEQTEIAEIKDRMQLEILNAETDAVIRGEKLEKAQLNDIIAKYGELQEDGDTIITHEDKYKISLKEIWYGVLSDSGSYTDKLEQIEILEKELADLKEQYKNLEDLNSGNSEVLADLQKQIATLESEKSAIEEEYREYREIITQAIKDAGGAEVGVDEVATKVAESIKNIIAEATKGATATEGDILNGKTAWVNGNKITGKMAYNGAISKTLNAGESYTVPAGYTTGGTIAANGLANQTQATATQNDIAEGKTAWVNGQLITGNGIETKMLSKVLCIEDVYFSTNKSASLENEITYAKIGYQLNGNKYSGVFTYNNGELTAGAGSQGAEYVHISINGTTVTCRQEASPSGTYDFIIFY